MDAGRARGIIRALSGHTLRLWTGAAGWYVERLGPDGAEGAVGASGGGDQYTVTEVLGGLAGRVPGVGARTILVGATGAALRQEVHAGMFLVPATVVGPTDPELPVTPLDVDGGPLTGQIMVPIAGRG